MTRLTNHCPETAEPNAAAPQPRRKRFWLLAGAAVVVASLAACAPGQHHRGDGPMGHSGQMDPEAMGRRVDKGVDRVLSDVQASAEQKQKVGAIVRQAIADLAPLRDKHRTARKSAVDLLAAPTIDRAAMEALRAEQMQLADQASRRMTQALADVADVLTPEQRVKLKERLERRMTRRWW
ncbi:MAG TPA: Spy/CpxP family protein refolding chaperone [Burkholderiaceae bacterium]|jgi:Spy/CpxP family protein refolding chaperone|nr:Spy/CpxP family protein refolding chaperone [Burkholderiaceae bacterium]